MQRGARLNNFKICEAKHAFCINEYSQKLFSLCLENFSCVIIVCNNHLKLESVLSEARLKNLKICEAKHAFCINEKS